MLNESSHSSWVIDIILSLWSYNISLPILTRWLMAGEHEVLRCVGIQWTSTWEDQWKAGHDWVCSCNGSGSSERAGCVWTNIQWWDPMVLGDKCGSDPCFLDSTVPRGECGVKVWRVHVLRCRAVEWEVCYVGFDSPGFYWVCQGRNPGVNSRVTHTEMVSLIFPG